MNGNIHLVMADGSDISQLNAAHGHFWFTNLGLRIIALDPPPMLWDRTIYNRIPFCSLSLAQLNLKTTRDLKLSITSVDCNVAGALFISFSSLFLLLTYFWSKLRAFSHQPRSIIVLSLSLLFCFRSLYPPINCHAHSWVLAHATEVAPLFI